MNQETKQLLAELQRLIGQVESVVAGTAGARAQASDSIDEIKEGLKQAGARAENLRRDVQDELGRGLKAGEELVRSQPWLAIGLAAALAFAVGMAVGRRK
jgi:ElaB/YqjD/DUF883 family membrane-anchored ribosome-binding protein